MRSHSHYDAVKSRRKFEEQLRDNGDEAKAKIADIAAHPETVVITRDTLPEPWIYVEDLFPRVAPALTNLKIYKNENTAFCRNIGVPASAGGLFFIKASAILICWSDDKFEDDVVVCHEMLHYTSQLLGGHMRFSDVEEDFAYSKSIAFLRERGYSEQWIAEEYMLPYYWGREWRKFKMDPLQKDAARADAIRVCKAIVEAELRGQKEPEETDDPDRFDVI